MLQMVTGAMDIQQSTGIAKLYIASVLQMGVKTSPVHFPITVENSAINNSKNKSCREGTTNLLGFKLLKMTQNLLIKIDGNKLFED